DNSPLYLHDALPISAMPADGQIMEISDLFLECFQNGQTRSFFIDLLIESLPEDNLHVIKKDLLALEAEELLQFVIEGATPNISRSEEHTSELQSRFD